MRTQLLHWRSDANAFDTSLLPRSPHFVLYFGPNDLIASVPFQDAMQQLAPQAAKLGCTTGTAICQSTLHDEQAFAVAGWLDSSSVKLASAEVCSETSLEAGAALAASLNRDDLAGVLVFCDSLNVDGMSLVQGLRENLKPGVVISGGLASDGSAFVHTIVGADCAPRAKLVGALGFYGRNLVMSQGCAHGWDNFGPPRRITKAAGLELFELDGSPALDLYERYLGSEAAELPASALRFPLLISNPDDPTEEVVRTVLGVDRTRRSMTFASPIPNGWNARLMRGAFDHLTEGARRAGELAAHGATPDGEGLALLVSCVGRRLVMGPDTADEVEAVAGALAQQMVLCGFYSHGEISTTSDEKRCGLHNQTMTIVTVQEAA